MASVAMFATIAAAFLAAGAQALDTSSGVLAATRWLNSAGNWKPQFCTWGGALAVLGELVDAMNAFAQSLGEARPRLAPDRCWWRAIWGWERRRKFLIDAWAVEAGSSEGASIGENVRWFESNAAGQTATMPPEFVSKKRLDEARDNCAKVASGWSVERVTLDIPRYLHDVRGCGRGRRELWEPIEVLHKEMKRGGEFTFAARSSAEVYLCLPMSVCSRSEVASGPVVLWLAHVFDLHAAFNSLPPLGLAHANVTTFPGRSSGSRGTPEVVETRKWFNEEEPRGATGSFSAPSHLSCQASGAAAADGWVYVRSQGRLGNVLMDLTNGLAVALQTGRKGVYVEPATSSAILPNADAPATSTASATASTGGKSMPGKAKPNGASLLGLLATPLKVPDDLRHDAEVLAALGRGRQRRMECAYDGQLSKLTRISAATHWAVAPVAAFCGVFPSCALPLKLRRRLLRALLLPLLESHCSQAVPKTDPEDLLTIHLRGGDAVPAGTPDHAQPPCVSYERALGLGQFKRVRMIAEDARNPCFEELLSKHSEAVVEARLGGSLIEDVCSLVGARNLFLAASTLATSVALLSNADHVLVPLPSEDFAPGPVSYGFGAAKYLDELCNAFDGRVFGFQPGRDYYMGEAGGDEQAARQAMIAHASAPVGPFSGISIERTRNHPASALRVLQCLGVTSSVPS